MNPDHRWLNFCQLWRHYTEAETAAIQAGDWVAIAAVQQQKQDLRLEMDAAAQPACPDQFRPLVAELIVMEQGNSRALTERRQAAESEQAGVELAQRSLRQLHAAYAPQSPPAWHSYS